MSSAVPAGAVCPAEGPVAASCRARAPTGQSRRGTTTAHLHGTAVPACTREGPGGDRRAPSAGDTGVVWRHVSQVSTVPYWASSSEGPQMTLSVFVLEPGPGIGKGLWPPRRARTKWTHSGSASLRKGAAPWLPTSWKHLEGGDGDENVPCPVPHGRPLPTSSPPTLAQPTQRACTGIPKGDAVARAR